MVKILNTFLQDYKQWGYINAGKVNFPISYTKQCFVNLATDSQNKGLAPVTVGISYLDKSYTNINPENAGVVFFVSIGC